MPKIQKDNLGEIWTATDGWITKLDQKYAEYKEIRNSALNQLMIFATLILTVYVSFFVLRETIEFKSDSQIFLMLLLFIGLVTFYVTYSWMNFIMKRREVAEELIGMYAVCKELSQMLISEYDHKDLDTYELLIHRVRITEIKNTLRKVARIVRREEFAFSDSEDDDIKINIAK